MVAAVAMVMVLVVVEQRVEMVAQWLGLRAGLPGLTWMAARTHLATMDRAFSTAGVALLTARTGPCDSALSGCARARSYPKNR